MELAGNSVNLENNQPITENTAKTDIPQLQAEVSVDHRVDENQSETHNLDKSHRKAEILKVSPKELGEKAFKRNTKPSLKMKRFVTHYLEHGNATRAVIQADYNVKNRQNAGVYGTALLRKDTIQNEMVRQLKGAGLDETYLSNTLREIIDEGKLRKVTSSEALRAVDIVLRLKGAYPAEKKTLESYSLQAELRGKTIEELQEQYNHLQEEKRRIIDGEPEQS